MKPSWFPLACACALAVVSTVPAAEVVGATTTRTYPAGKPPWYHGDMPAAGRTAFAVRAAAAPEGTPDSWWPRAALERLAAAADARLQVAGVMRRSTHDVAVAGAPSVYVGCAIDISAAGDCDDASRDMVFSITSGTKRWQTETVRAALAGARADRLLLVTVEIREHWLTQKDWKGHKEIPLGTGLAQPAPWLTSLDTPVQVLQLAGVVVDPAGRVVRSGVEGVTASRTRFVESAAGLQRVMTPEEIDEARTALRRADLPGSPLAWEAALDRLVSGLLGPA